MWFSSSSRISYPLLCKCQCKMNGKSSHISEHLFTFVYTIVVFLGKRDNDLLWVYVNNIGNVAFTSVFI